MGHGAARAGSRMTPWAVTATIPKRTLPHLNAVACGIGLVLGTKPNSAEMGIVSPDFMQAQYNQCITIIDLRTLGSSRMASVRSAFALSTWPFSNQAFPR